MPNDTYKFPIYAEHGSARCYRCSLPLTNHQESGFPEGRGQFKAYCSSCGYTTWYENPNWMFEDLGGDTVRDAANAEWTARSQQFHRRRTA